jgi:hypothetical protein
MNPSTPEFPLSSHAEEMATRGFDVFPLAPWSKKPRAGSHGKDDARSDVTGEGWAQATSYGVVPGKGVLIVDVDPLNGGDESLRDLEARYVPLPVTLTVRTIHASGEQRYFRTSRPVGSTAGRLGPGLDIRGERSGYGVGPGSWVRCNDGDRHCEKDESQPPHDGEYTLLSDCDEIAHAPVWLLDLLTEPPPRPEHQETESSARELIFEGERNDILFRAGARLRGAGASLDAIDLSLQQMNQELCQPPLSASEVRRIADSCERYPTGPDPELHQALPPQADDWVASVISGGSFALDIPATPPAVWGEGENILWAAGEAAILFGPQGCGKSTLAQQLALRRIGIGGVSLLEFSVRQGNRVLYIAGDRPSQVRRSLARMVSEADREILDDRLVVWEGPLPFNLVSDPESLARFCEELAADTVIIDSLKDVAYDLVDHGTGSRVNAAYQHCVRAGVEVLVLHHPRKATGDNKKPSKIDDIYGSTWLTAGCGSILCLWGEAGDPIVELSQLKSPMDEVPPFKVIHDNVLGASTRYEQNDLLTLLRASASGVTAKDAASALFGKPSPNANETAKARRQLEGLERKKSVVPIPGQSGGPGGSQPTRWFLQDRREDGPGADTDSRYAHSEGDATTGHVEQIRAQVTNPITTASGADPEADTADTHQADPFATPSIEGGDVAELNPSLVGRA